MKSSSKGIFKAEELGAVRGGVQTLRFREMDTEKNGSLPTASPATASPKGPEGKEFRLLFVEPLEEFSSPAAGGEREAAPPPPPAEIQKLREEWLERARKEAEKIVREAQEKAALIEREAYERGYAEGEKTGIEIGEKRFKTAVQSLGEALEAFKKEMTRILEDSESEIVRLALAVARKVVHAEVVRNADVVLQNLRDVFRMVAEKDAVRVRLNPKDAERAQAIQQDLSERFPEIKSLTFEADESIGKGGAVVETDFGDLDARLESQLERLEHALLTTMEERTSKGKSDALD